jgi:hypothetical protein
MSVEMEIKPLLTDSESISLGNLIHEVNELLECTEAMTCTEAQKNTYLKQIESIKHYIKIFENPEEIKKRKNWNYENCRNTLISNMIHGLESTKKNLLTNKQFFINYKQIPFLEDLIVQGRDTIIELEDDNKRMLKQILENTGIIEGLEATISEREERINGSRILDHS